MLAAILVIAGRRKLAIACAIVLVIDWLVPPLVASLYVRPNELTLEKPYIVRHIEATRAAYGLDTRAKVVDFNAQKEGRIDFEANRSMLENVRLWDWRAFHDTLSQSQPLRPYTYADTDVDRYQIDGASAPDSARAARIGSESTGRRAQSLDQSRLTFTHGYGFVMAEANRISEPDCRNCWCWMRRSR